MNISIDETSIDDFERQGVVLLSSLIEPELVERLRAATDKALMRSENYFRRLRVWETDLDCREACLASAAPAAAAKLLRTRKINLFYDQVFTKPAGAPATPWHNDQPYWPVRGWPVVTVWLALDEVTFDSGPLEFIAGSHRWDRWFRPFIAASDGAVEAVSPELDAEYEPLPDFDAEREQHTILCWEMQPGDALAFHALAVHGARNNSAAHPRRGYAMRFTGAGTEYYLGPGVNPRITNPALVPGDPMDSDQYPVAYRTEG